MYMIFLTHEQMAQYYKTRPSAVAIVDEAVDVEPASNVDRTLSEYDKLRHTLLSDDADEGWASELRRYLGTIQRDVTKDSDVVKWWQVRVLFTNHSLFANRNLCRTIVKSIRRLRVLRSMSFLLKLHLYLVNECFLVRNKLRLTAERL